MPLLAGFAEVDVTPPLGTHKIGWLIEIVSEYVLDPLFAHAAVFECDGQQIGFIQFDTLSIRWTQVNDIRRRISEQFGFLGDVADVNAGRILEPDDRHAVAPAQGDELVQAIQGNVGVAADPAPARDTSLISAPGFPRRC